MFALLCLRFFFVCVYGAGLGGGGRGWGGVVAGRLRPVKSISLIFSQVNHKVG